MPIAPRLPALIGGSADLDPSTYTALKGLGDFEPRRNERLRYAGPSGGGWSYAGRNLHFGVREHAMGAILNGLAAHGGTMPFGATFLIFSDYMRPPIRLAALMGLHVIYVFTHDSIALGRGRPDPPAGRAARRPARDSGPHGHPPRRCQRDRRRLAGRAGDAGPSSRAGSDPAGRADTRPYPICRGRRLAARCVRPGRRAGRQAGH